jgi:hypothetical protein
MAEAERPTHIVTFILDNGATLSSEETFLGLDEEEGDTALSRMLDHIDNDRDLGNWKIAGEMAAFHRRIVGVKCEEL